MQKKHGAMKLVCKGTFFITVGGRIIQEAYHASKFSPQDAAAYFLSNNFEVFV